jgi:hypothetical protein
MATLIQPDGGETTVEPRNGSDFQLDELQGFIGGGCIELVYLPDGSLMVIDEEGKLKGFTPNPVATMLYDNPDDIIVGPALVCKQSEVE